MKKVFAVIVLMIVVHYVHSQDVKTENQDSTDKSAVTSGKPSESVFPGVWRPLFDGETLNGWKIVRYGGEGEPHVANGALVLPKPVSGLMTGVCWDGDPLPVNNYAIYYEARRTEGLDIFAGLTFPYKDKYASLILGGWSGIVNGLSSINGSDASENETKQLFSLNNNQWYQIELRVTADSICATLDTKQILNLATAGKQIHLRPGSIGEGLTLWSYLSTGEIRNLRIKKLPSYLKK